MSRDVAGTLSLAVDELLLLVCLLQLVVVYPDGDEHVGDEVEDIHELVADPVPVDERRRVTPVLPVELAGNLPGELDRGGEDVVLQAFRNLSRRLIPRPLEAVRFSLELDGG